MWMWFKTFENLLSKSCFWFYLKLVANINMQCIVIFYTCLSFKMKHSLRVFYLFFPLFKEKDFPAYAEGQSPNLCSWFLLTLNSPEPFPRDYSLSLPFLSLPTGSFSSSKKQRVQLFFIIFKKFFYWSRVDLQCFISFRCTP